MGVKELIDKDGRWLINPLILMVRKYRLYLKLGIKLVNNFCL